MASDPAKEPDDTRNWDAVDIFVFSNGQQNSPPRKYHLQVDDLTWWKTTMKNLAKAQYGPLHSIIDLYTLDGEKVPGPLQVTNGATYVAVEPPDAFIDAGYDKYLIKASRSWEKRQSKLNGSCEKSADKLNVVSESLRGQDIDENEEIKMREESLLLKTIISSVVNNEPSIIVKPEPITNTEKSTKTSNGIPVKLIEKKRTSLQRSAIVKKTPPITTPVPNIKPAFKRKDSLKTANVTIAKPEGEKNSVTSNQLAKFPVKSKIYKPVNKPKESPIPEIVVSAIPKTIHQLTSNNIAAQNDRGMLTDNSKVGNVIGDKEIVLVSTLHKNPHLEKSSFVDESYEKIQDAYPIKPQLLNEQSLTKTDKNELNSINIEALNNPGRNEIIAYNDQSSPKSHSNDRNHIQNTETNLQVNSKTKSNYFESKESTIKTNDFSIPNRASEVNLNNEIKVSETKHNANSQSHEKKELAAPEQLNISTLILNDDKRKVEPNINHLDMSKTDESKTHDLTLKIYTTINNQGPGVQNESYAKIEENVKPTDEINTSSSKNNVPIKTNDLIHSDMNKFSNDGYVAKLNKGDIVNLKLNIKIQNDSYSNKHDNYVQSTMNISHVEKHSQINIVNKSISPNKSLISLITQEIEKHKFVNTHHSFVIVQCKGCQHCIDPNVAVSDTNSDIKKYAILVPVGKSQETLGERLNTDIIQHQSSVLQPVKSSISCTSLQRLTKMTNVGSLTATASKQINNSNATSKANIEVNNSENNMTKKSKAITTESTLNSREVSKISFNITTLTEQITSKEDREKSNKATTDNFTQTEWCDTLLEARIEDDGHYTFRLPSLTTLKNPKLS